jgi:membrane protease subunit (stomatin/prohibitin family)
MLRDKDFGSVRLRGFGTYSFKVVDVKTFMQEVFGTNALYTVNDITNHNRPLLIQGVTDAIAESKISVLDLAASYKEFADQIKTLTNPEFIKLGMKLTNVVVENISLPEEVEKYLDQRTKLGMMEDKLDVYTRMKAADALGDAAKNEGGGGLAGLGVGLGTGSAIGQMFASSLASTTGHKVVPSQNVEGKVCVCGAVNPAKAKFCSECGAKLATKSYCSHCGAEVKNSAKFCGECGTKLGN